MYHPGRHVRCSAVSLFPSGPKSAAQGNVCNALHRTRFSSQWCDLDKVLCSLYFYVMFHVWIFPPVLSFTAPGFPLRVLCVDDTDPKQVNARDVEDFLWQKRRLNSAKGTRHYLILLSR